MTSPRKPSEVLTLALSVIACLAFVLSLRDLPGRRLATPAFKIAEPIRISGLERKASLRVVVATEKAAGIGAATVQVFWEHDARFYWAGAAVTDNAGQTELRELPEGRVWLLAEAPGFARSSSALVLSAGTPRDARLVLRAAQRLEVTVEDEAALPVAKATVLVDTADPLPFGALTDEHGVARFARLGAAPWTVKASAPGYESVSRTSVRGPVAITLRRLATLEVAVLGVDGKPAPGASVMIAGPTLWPARSAATDGLGIARIAGLLAGSYDLRASLADAVAPTLLGFELARGAHERLTLRLEPGRTVVALVTDGAGPSPIVVANADVVLAEGGVSSFPIRGRSGSDGKVALGPIASGPATLGARAEDFVGSALVAVPDVLTGPVRIPLTRGATIRGEVSDARGFPVDGASVEVVGSDASGLPIAETPALVGFRQNHFAWSLPGPVPLIPAGELGVMPGPVPPIPKPGAEPELGAAASDFQQPLAELAPWVTNRGGQFTARPITPGRVRVIVRHPDYVEGTSELVSVLPGGEAQVKLVLLKGGSLEGRVADERDQPVPGVEVELSSPNATRTELATTASDGTFAFAAVPSDVTLSLARPDDPSRVVLRKSLHVAEGAKLTVSLVLPATRDPVRVVVEDEDERPIELVEVAVTSLEPARPMRLTRFTDSEGAVTLDDALGENLRIVAEAPGFARVAQSVAAAPKELKVVLKRGVLVEGRVTAVRGRRLVVGAVVTLQQEGVRKVATTDGDGAFRLRDVAPGDVRIRVEHPDFADEESTLRVESTGRADRPFALPEIDLSDAGEVEGEVVDEHGARVAGARVMAGDVPSYLPAGRPRRGVVLSDDDGHFMLPGVHPGSLTISAISAISGRGAVRAVEVSAGHTTRGLRIQVTPSAQPTDSESVAAGSVAVTLGERGTSPNVEVVVVSVAEGSEAERAGVLSGDVITALDGAHPSSMGDARSRLSGQLGTDLVLELVRAGATLRFRVLREAVRR
ncbi:MAG TPA: carboxypeptidase regulatory-like domain-containing protein [Polyangiaceae bacterium]